MELLIATGNREKGEEIRAILAGIEGLRTRTLADLEAPPPEPEEDGNTLEENAYIKARTIFDATGIATIADDTGLEVDALGGAPGVHSARYAGERATYADNCRRLIEELGSTERRAGRFRTVICLVDSFRTLFAEGEVEGEILRAPRGEKGFGYDPLFVPAGERRTFAEMSAEEKNQISHRGRALAAMRALLAEYAEPEPAGDGEGA